MADKKKASKKQSFSESATAKVKTAANRPKADQPRAGKSANPKKLPAREAREETIRWKAPDYYTFEKSPYWSFAVGLIAILLSLVLLYTNNIFPIIIIILAVIVTFQVSHEKPKAEEFAIDEGGLVARNEYFPYLELKSFWITSHGTKKILYFEPVNQFKAPIAIPLGQQSAAEARFFLLKYLPERMGYSELLSDKLIRIFKL